MSEELLPCPFCGKEPRERQLQAWENAVFQIKCWGCMAESGEYEFLNNAIAAWNRRSPSPVESMPKVVKTNPKACARCGHGPSRHGMDTGACAEYLAPSPVAKEE